MHEKDGKRKKTTRKARKPNRDSKVKQTAENAARQSHRDPLWGEQEAAGKAALVGRRAGGWRGRKAALAGRRAWADGGKKRPWRAAGRGLMAKARSRARAAATRPKKAR